MGRYCDIGRFWQERILCLDNCTPERVKGRISRLTAHLPKYSLSWQDPLFVQGVIGYDICDCTNGAYTASKQ